MRPLRSDRFQYTPGKSLGSPDPTSFKGDTETGDGHAMTEALEQIAFELRTANLIAYAAILKTHPHPLLRINYLRDEVSVRLGIAERKKVDQ